MGRLKRLVVPGLLTLALYWAVFGGEYSAFEVRRARLETEQQRAELARLRHRIDSLQAWIDSLQTDSATIEKLARERFGMIRDGELLYRLVQPEDTAGIAKDTTGR